MTPRHTPTITVGDLARRLGAECPAGLGDRILSGISTLEAAGEDQVAYVVKEKFLAAARTSRAAVIVAPKTLALDRDNLLRVNSVMESAIAVLDFFHPDPARSAHIHPTAVVAPSVKVGADVHIGPGVVIEDNVVLGDRVRIEAQCFIGRDAILGDDTWLSPRVVLMHETKLGRRVRIHPGAVIGADGFRIEVVGGRLRKIPQVGCVVLEDDVEIGANTTVDRASMTETRIGARTKVDNLVQIGHNVVIGSDCVIVAQVGIAGSTKLGRGVMLGGGVGVKDNITIGDRARVAGRSGVQNNLPAGSDVMGLPAIPVKDYARFAAFYRRFSRHWKTLQPLLTSPQESEDTGGSEQEQ